MSPAAASSSVGPTALCPLCGGPNRCAMEEARRDGRVASVCWCTRVAFPTDVLERIPAQARGVACVCERCATAGASPAAGA